MGFGHRVYKAGDIRAKVLRDHARKAAERTGQMTWEETADIIERVMQAEKNLLPLFAAVRLWAVVILLGVGSLPFFWLPAGERLPTRAWRLYLLWLLMLAQFPVVFSIERANVDLVPLLMWSLSFLLFRTGRDVFAGALAGLAAASKLYPAISCAVVGFGLVGSALLVRAVGLKRAASFCAGMLATVLAGTAFFPQSQDYFLRVLPAS